MQCVRSLTLLLLLVVEVHGDFVEPPQPHTSLRSLAESQTRLPCRYQPVGGEKVVQVTWYKELADGSKDQIITAHFSEGHTEFGRYSGRVNTEESDEGSYICHISTFPNGNFERHITLTVWILPISTLDPVILKEGESYRVAASCRAVGRPPPRLSWDTDLPGQSQNRTSEGGSVSSYFSLHPLRSMNGKKLDCLVWHPGLNGPRRISNHMEVQYPPDATITSVSGDWFAGLENAELVCDSGGNPKPQDFTWTRRGGALPDGVSVVGGKLVFGRTLRLNDSGVYECVAKNIAGAGKAEYSVTIAESSRSTGFVNDENFLLIVLGSSAAALVLVLILVVLLVNRHHRNRNRKLERQLTEKTDEINSLSRQNSFRRLNSVSSDPRVKSEDYALLRVDSRMKNSQMSLERPIYKGSQSTLGGKWSPAGRSGAGRAGTSGHLAGRQGEPETDGDGRREGGAQERVESFLKSSNMSLDSGLPSSLVPLKVQQEEGPGEPDLALLGEGGSPRVEDWAPTQSVEEEREDDDDGSSSYQISEALTNHFYLSNGFLRPRQHSNAILLHPKGQII
ncbi:unnamed protein product [Pleuronectes platessa]|uniref:Ig-like domain-containing protein n=1 Tax=Pleuronectes platessa TaxID=8262 RepID=A0A9N7VFD5_PLEPL|nr:unnamed protein product [Pleuronectes platessa]